ncbi:MAG: MCE family protein [Candidatus Cloacimonetes bacterium]|nr:MCE family protein [Candidatus Cloacimonadota bacterium]
MVSNAQKFRLGIFIISSSIVMIVFFVFVIGDRLMEKRDTYFVNYEDVSVNGLQVGGSVKYHGINVGRVESIDIDKSDIRNVIVAISLNAGTPIKKDVLATLVPVGITGLKQIELSGGSNEADILAVGSDITAGQSMFDNITGKAEVIAEKLEMVLNNISEITNKENWSRINNIIANVDMIIEENRKPIAGVISNLDSTAAYLVDLSRSSRKVSQKIDTILQSDSFENILSNTEKISQDIADGDIKKLLEELNTTVDQANKAFNHIDLMVMNSRQDILETLEILQETIEYLNEFSRQISENPGILLRSKKQE